MIKYICAIGAVLLAGGLFFWWEGFSLLAKTLMASGLLFMVWLLIKI